MVVVVNPPLRSISSVSVTSLAPRNSKRLPFALERLKKSSVFATSPRQVLMVSAEISSTIIIGQCYIPQVDVNRSIIYVSGFMRGHRILLIL